MGELRDKDIIRTKPTKVSTLFDLPKDLDEGSLHALQDGADDTYEEGSLVTGDDDANPDEKSPDEAAIDPNDPNYNPWKPTLDPIALAAPTTFTIKSQTFRSSADGKYVVDVVIEFGDIDGAEGYEVRIAR